MKASKILLFSFFLLFCQIAFAQTVNSSVKINIKNGSYAVSGIVTSDSVKNEVIEKIKTQLGSDADFSKISIQPNARPFQADWQPEFDKSLLKIKAWKSGVFIFSNNKRLPVPNYAPLPEDIANAQILLTTGQTVSLKDYRNKVVVLFLFAAWNPPGISQAEDLNKFYSRVSSRNVEIIGISIENEPAERRDFLKFLERHNFQYKLGWVGWDIVQSFAEFSKSEGILQAFVTFNGRLRGVFAGYSPFLKRNLEKLIVEILDENNL